MKLVSFSWFVWLPPAHKYFRENPSEIASEICREVASRPPSEIASEIAGEIAVKLIFLINTSVQNFTAISPAISLAISLRVFTSNFMAASLDTCIINFTKHISSNFTKNLTLKFHSLFAKGLPRWHSSLRGVAAPLSLLGISIVVLMMLQLGTLLLLPTQAEDGLERFIDTVRRVPHWLALSPSRHSRHPRKTLFNY